MWELHCLHDNRKSPKCKVLASVRQAPPGSGETFFNLSKTQAAWLQCGWAADCTVSPGSAWWACPAAPASSAHPSVRTSYRPPSAWAQWASPVCPCWYGPSVPLWIIPPWVFCFQNRHHLEKKVRREWLAMPPVTSQLHCTKSSYDLGYSQPFSIKLWSPPRHPGEHRCLHKTTSFKHKTKLSYLGGS